MTYHEIADIIKFGCEHTSTPSVCLPCAKAMLNCAVEFVVKNTINVIHNLPVDIS